MRECLRNEIVRPQPSYGDSDYRTPLAATFFVRVSMYACDTTWETIVENFSLQFIFIIIFLRSCEADECKV